MLLCKLRDERVSRDMARGKWYHAEVKNFERYVDVAQKYVSSIWLPEAQGLFPRGWQRKDVSVLHQHLYWMGTVCATRCFAPCDGRKMFFFHSKYTVLCLSVCSLWVRQNEPGQHNGASFMSVQNWPAHVEARVAITPVRIDLTFRRRFFKYLKIPLSLLVRFA